MDKAKHAVSSFMAKSGHHDTTVHESVAPSVQKETINEHLREEKQVAKDREIHQDHYHTSVQPVKDQEVLAEKHHHNLVGVEHRTHDHRDHSETKHKLQSEAAQFKNESVRASAHHSTATTVPEVVGEHVHHHVHETIQPVIHKETIEPHVIHTTVPVHETHHNAAQHHTASALPAVSLSEFKNQGGSLTGRAEQHDHFTGEPKSIETGSNYNSQGTVGTGVGIGSRQSNNQGSTGTGVGVGSGESNNHYISGNSSDAHHQATAGSQGNKPSLMDKLNPMKDSNGDGQKGFMK